MAAPALSHAPATAAPRDVSPDLAVEILPHLLAGASDLDALRAALRVPAQLRIHGARTTIFFAGIILAQAPGIREMARASLRAALGNYRRLAALVGATTDHAAEGYHPLVLAVMADAVPRSSGARASVTGYERMIARHLATVEAGGEPPADAYDDLLRYIYGTLHPALQDFSTAVGEACAVHRQRRDAAALLACDRAMDARARIDEIARTVRLISLNARVEAAHAGGAGRVFGVIAQEIKQLSEQAEAVSQELAASVHDMMANLRAS